MKIILRDAVFLLNLSCFCVNCSSEYGSFLREQAVPELPEVETTLRGIKPHMQGQMIKKVIVRHHQLRWPIPKSLAKTLEGEVILDLTRRGKYLLLTLKNGTLIVHLGMSGRIRLLMEPLSPQKHDHIDIELLNTTVMRFTDPRRFGAFLWTKDDPMQHPVLRHLGVEPLEAHFTGAYLYQQAQGRKVAVKSWIMNSAIVVGVGNIYATEALFSAKIHPLKPAGTLSLEQCKNLVKAIRSILKKAIRQGGTTLKDFLNSEGKPGYFVNRLQVYGRAGLPCVECAVPLSSLKIGQRGTVFCEQCQMDLVLSRSS